MGGRPAADRGQRQSQLSNSVPPAHRLFRESDDDGEMGTWVLRLANDGQGPRLAVKDCIDVAGLPTTAGCPVVAEMAEPAEIATVTGGFDAGNPVGSRGRLPSPVLAPA
jgi:hypothetical protein